MTDRLTADTINDGALDSLYDQLDRLRAGEEDGYDPLTIPTPGQWIWVWNRATPEERHRIVAAFLDDAATASLCRFEGHKQRLDEDRKAWVTLGRVRALADRWGSALAPDSTYARALRAALDEPAPVSSGPAATQATGIRGLLEHVGIDTSGRDITVAGKAVDADPDDPPVQCWHTEPDTPCDWDVCKQPERLAAGDYGTDPREQH